MSLIKNIVGGEYGAAKYHVVWQDENGNWDDIISLPDAGEAFNVFNAAKQARPRARLRLVATTVMQEHRGDLKGASE